MSTIESILPREQRTRPRTFGRKFLYSLSAIPRLWVSVVLMLLGALVTGAAAYVVRIPNVDWTVTWGVLLALFAIVHPNLVDVVKRNDRRKPLQSQDEIAGTSAELLDEALWDHDGRPVYAIAPMIAPGLLGHCESSTNGKGPDHCQDVLRSLLQLAETAPVYVLACKEEDLAGPLSDPNADLLYKLVQSLKSETTSGQIFHAGMDLLPDFEFLSKAPHVLASLRTKTLSGKAVPIGWVSELANAEDIGVQVFVNALRDTGNVDLVQLEEVARLVQAPAEEVLMACTLTRFNFFRAVSQIYNTIGRDGTVYIVNESARPEPRVLQGFEKARGQIQILWISPADLADSSRRQALLGMLVRMEIAEKKAARGAAPLALKALQPSAAKLKFVAGDKKVVCGSVLHRDSGIGIVLKNQQWVDRVYEHYHKLERVASDVTSTIADILAREVAGHGGNVEKTPLWGEIDYFCGTWRNFYVQDNVDMPFSADGLRTRVQGLLA